MCAMEISRPSRIIHQSIIKEIKSIDSRESGLSNSKNIKSVKKIIPCFSFKIASQSMIIIIEIHLFYH
jgi:hypothetical protein